MTRSGSSFQSQSGEASESGGSGSINGYTPPDYATVEIPTKPPSEYSYVERRAELLEQINNLGHPSMINQREEADRYGVSQPTICKDIKRIGEYVSGEFGDSDRQILVTESVVQRSLRGMIEEQEWQKAAKTAMKWHEFVEERTTLQEIDERLSAIESDDRG